jgi:D-alanyl-lipoteichoic acid acyltransferase DltB (MBOAT superfamily)
MNFFDPEFIGFYLIIFFLYYKVKNQQAVLLIASSLFVGLLSFSFLIYTYFFILFNYSVALLVKHYSYNPKVKKLICNTGILLNISSLVYFKYLDFILASVTGFFNLFDYALPIKALNIIVPIGISYFTLQGISYLLQVYRGHEQAERNIIVFSNFILFFPKFLSGPIELSKTFIPQLRKSFAFEYPDVREGFKLILWGAFKKIVIADRLAIIINGVYSDVHSFTGIPLLITFVLQPLHLYCDFSGYTDIALGMGKTFGLNLTNNFKRPFFSTSVTMFWQRMHISLTFWCNEYIFKRLSFKLRKWGYWAPVFAVIITFLILGLWHGPRWTFIIVGLLQGIAINYEYFTKRYRLAVGKKLPPKFVFYISCLFTYLFYCLTMTFYNSLKLGDVSYFISNMFTNINFANLNMSIISRIDKIIAFFSLLLVFIVEFRQENGKDVFQEIGFWPAWIRRACYYSLCILIIYFGSSMNQFVYMKF